MYLQFIFHLFILHFEMDMQWACFIWEVVNCGIPNYRDDREWAKYRDGPKINVEMDLLISKWRYLIF